MSDEFDDDVDIRECANGCGELVHLGGFCSMLCHQEYDEERGIYDDLPEM